MKSSTSITHLQAIFYPVKNADRALRFYRDKLGLKVRKKPLPKWIELNLKGITFALDGYWTKSRGGVIILRVRRIESHYEDLKKKGVRFLGPILNHPWGRNVSFKDSEGNIIQLFEPPRKRTIQKA